MTKAKLNKVVKILKIVNNGKLGQVEKGLIVEVIRKVA